MDIILPLSAIIKSPHTNGEITSLCFNTLRRFVHSYNLNDEIMEELILVSTRCRFESVDKQQDEPALLAIVSLQLDCLRTRMSTNLSDTVIWEVFKTAFRVKQQITTPDYSSLLCNTVTLILVEITEIIFNKLKKYSNNTEIFTVQSFKKLIFEDNKKVFSLIKKLAEKRNSPVKPIALALRYALSGLSSGVNMGDLMVILGSEEVKKRLINLL